MTIFFNIQLLVFYYLSNIDSLKFRINLPLSNLICDLSVSTFKCKLSLGVWELTIMLLVANLANTKKND